MFNLFYGSHCRNFSIEWMCAERPTFPFERITWEYKIYLDQHNRLNKYPLSEYIMERWNIKENGDTLLKNKFISAGK